MTTGINIGRFQVPELTLGHKALLIKAYDLFDQIGILLGYPDWPDKDNPLTMGMRSQMLSEWDPVFVGGLKDVPGDDYAWTREVDKQVAYWSENCRLGRVTLVGGRKSFVPHYKGSIPCSEIPVWVGKSGTEVRQSVSRAD